MILEAFQVVRAHATTFRARCKLALMLIPFVHGMMIGMIEQRKILSALDKEKRLNK